MVGSRLQGGLVLVVGFGHEDAGGDKLDMGDGEVGGTVLARDRAPHEQHEAAQRPEVAGEDAWPG